MRHTKQILTGLNHLDYEHPFDQKALRALENTPGLKLVGNFITKNTIEKVYTVQYTGSSIKVNRTNYPSIYEYLQYACQVLDVKNVPDLYVQWGYDINACTIGAEHPMIVLNSGLIDLCTDDEIMFVIGHELGHIKSNHMLYHMMCQVINSIIGQIPFGGVAAAPIQYALWHWNRMSEYTADRAGLLCCQNKEAANSAFMKMSGAPIKEHSHLDYHTFLEQAKEFCDLDYDGLTRFFKYITIADDTHPWTVLRAAALMNWIVEGGYGRFVRAIPTPTTRPVLPSITHRGLSSSQSRALDDIAQKWRK